MFKNKALWITLAIIVVLLFAGYSWVKGTYNTMVTQDEGVKTAWSQGRKSISAPYGPDPKPGQYGKRICSS